MTDTRPPVAPVEGFAPLPEEFAKVWDDNREALYSGEPVAISAAFEASGILEENARLREALRKIDNLVKLADAVNLVKLADAVLDHADAHCRAFPIATAPRNKAFLAWSGETWTPVRWDKYAAAWLCEIESTVAFGENDPPTHWRPLPPPPTTPPLPAVFVELGAALERLKEGR